MDLVQLKPWAVVLINDHTGKVSVLFRAVTFEEAAEIATKAEIARAEYPLLNAHNMSLHIWHASQLLSHNSSLLSWRQP